MSQYISKQKNIKLDNKGIRILTLAAVFLVYFVRRYLAIPEGFNLDFSMMESVLVGIIVAGFSGVLLVINLILNKFLDNKIKPLNITALVFEVLFWLGLFVYSWFGYRADLNTFVSFFFDILKQLPSWFIKLF